jgi:hypothetical protein
MPGQTIGTVNVQVNSGGQGSTVRSISYGARSLKSATDLSLTSHANGSSIIYNAATDSFVLGQPTAAVASVDAGTF